MQGVSDVCLLGGACVLVGEQGEDGECVVGDACKG